MSARNKLIQAWKLANMQCFNDSAAVGASSGQGTGDVCRLKKSERDGNFGSWRGTKLCLTFNKYSNLKINKILLLQEGKGRREPPILAVGGRERDSDRWRRRAFCAAP